VHTSTTPHLREAAIGGCEPDHPPSLPACSAPVARPALPLEGPRRPETLSRAETDVMQATPSCLVHGATPGDATPPHTAHTIRVVALSGRGASETGTAVLHQYWALPEASLVTASPRLGPSPLGSPPTRHRGHQLDNPDQARHRGVPDPSHSQSESPEPAGGRQVS
jgi:hypothetical protein